MSPQILVRGKNAKAMYGTCFISKGLYPDVNVSLANSFDTSFNTLVTSERDITMWGALISIHIRSLKYY